MVTNNLRNAGRGESRASNEIAAALADKNTEERVKKHASKRPRPLLLRMSMTIYDPQQLKKGRPDESRASIGIEALADKNTEELVAKHASKRPCPLLLRMSMTT